MDVDKENKGGKESLKPGSSDPDNQPPSILHSESKLPSTSDSDNQPPSILHSESKLPSTSDSENQPPSILHSESKLPSTSDSDNQPPSILHSESKLPSTSDSDNQPPSILHSESKLPSASDSDNQPPSILHSESKLPSARDSDNQSPSILHSESELPSASDSDNQPPSIFDPESEIPSASDSDNQPPSILDSERQRTIISNFLQMAEDDNVDVLQQLASAMGDNEEMRQVFGFLVDKGSIDGNMLKYLFGQVSEADVIDENGMSPLQRAAKAGNLFVVKLLLNGKDADCKRRDNTGMTALSFAAKFGHLDVVELLLKNGSDLNSLDMNQMSPLVLAVDAFEWNVAKFLVGQGADINIADRKGNNALQRVVESGAWSMVNCLISLGADVNVLDSYNRYPLQYAVDAGNWNVAKHMVEKGAKISCLTPVEKDTLLDVVVGQNAEQYRDFYNVIRVSNSELLDMLIRKKGGDGKTSYEVALKKLEPLLSEAYEALKVRNVPLSTEIEFMVENKIINSRFFVAKEDIIDNPLKITVEDVNARIVMVVDWINDLNAKYSGDDGKELDEEFLIISRFVAQNIRVLKRKLRSTYNKLPWEEIEFCLAVFISSRKGVNPNTIYRLLLYQERMLSHLSRFSDEIMKQKSSITEQDLNSNFPVKQNPKLSARSDIVKSVIANNPLFEDVYSDYRLAKNMYSLQRIEAYIRLAFSVNINEKEELGKFVIERALQVIGESLKNTVESPNVSDDIHERLIRSAPRNVRGIMSSLRDSLSHSHALTNKLELEENSDVGIFIKIRNDLDKIDAEIGDILNKNKLQLLEMYADKITNSKSLEEIKKLGKNIEEVDFRHFLSEKEIEGRHLEKLKVLIDELNEEVKNRTEEEIGYFKKINTILDLELSKTKLGRDTFKTSLTEMKDLSNKIRFTTDMKSIQKMSKNLIYIDKTIPEALNNILEYSSNLMLSYQSRTSSVGYDKVAEIAYRVAFQVQFELGRVGGLHELTEKLENREIETIGNVESNIHMVFDDVERSLDTEQERVTFRREIDSKRNSFEAKQKLKLILKQLKEGSVSLASTSVTQKYEELCFQLNLKKAKKRMLDNKFYSSEYEECNNIVENLRDNYEIFINSVNNSLEKDSRDLLANHFKSLFTHIFKSQNFLRKLKNDVDKILQENPKQLKNFYEKRLSTLSRFISTMNGPDFLHVIKQDRTLQAAVEVIVLDLTEIIESVSLYGDNRLFLDQFSPLLTGKHLRNFLAHGDTLMDVLPFDPSTSLVSTAFKLIEEGTGLITKENILIGLKITDDSTNFNFLYDKKLKQFQDQYRMFLAASIGDVPTVKDSTENGADINAQDLNGMSGLHYAAAGDNLDTLLFLLDNNLSLNSRNSIGQSILHIAAVCGSDSVIKFVLDQKLMSIDEVDSLNITPLLYAALSGNADTVEALLENGANIEATDDENRTALHLSVIYGLTDVVKVLVAKNANVNAISMGDLTPLHMALFQDHTEIVDILLRNGADEVSRVDINEPLLNTALLGGQTETAKRLLDNGANVNEASNASTTPLHLAAKFGQVEILKELLERGANIDAPNDKGWTPLDYAALLEQTEVVRLLLDNGANPSTLTYDGRTALHFAATAGAKDIVGYLLDMGANVNSLTNEKHTPLYFAAVNGQKDVVIELIERGANVNVVEGNKVGALHFGAFNGHKDVVVVLLDRGADVNAYDDKGHAPLHMAILAKQSEIVDVLLDYDADINSRDKSGMTPLMYAATNKSVNIVATLLRRGATVDLSTLDNITALHSAAETGNKDIVNMLLANGAFINSLTNDNWTPLHYASSNGHVNVVKFLLERGANVNAIGKNNMTPLHLASLGGHTNIVELLVANGANFDALAISDKRNITPLDLASAAGHLRLVEDLLKNVANLEEFGGGQLALQVAIQFNYEDIVKVLLEKGANVNYYHDNGFTPLQFATTLGHKGMIELLLDNGADINNPNRSGDSCLHVASKSGRNDIVVTLINRGAQIDVVDGEGRTPLLVAAIGNHIDVVESLLNGGANVDCIDSKQMTVLHYSARNGYTDIVNALIEHHANVNTIDGDNFTPLMYAARNGHKIVIEVLLLNGSEVDPKDNVGTTALNQAATNGHVDIVSLLLQSGANIDAHGENELTAMHISAELGNLAIVDVLIANGAAIDAKDVKGSTPLFYAAGSGHTDVVTALLQAGANVNAQNNNLFTPLQIAASNGHTDVVYSLLANGGSVDAACLNNLVALHLSAFNGHVGVVRALLENKANVEARDVDGSSALHCSAQGRHKDVAKALLEHGCNVNARDQNGWTALHEASDNGNSELVKILLNNGANVDCENIDSWTPLLKASIQGHTDVVKVLIENKANMEAQLKSKWTPLYAATSKGHLDVVIVLLSSGANIEARSKDNWTSLHCAVSLGHKDIVSELCRKGANVNARNNKNQSVLYFAVFYRDIDIVKALLEFGADVNAVDDEHVTSFHLAAFSGDVKIGDALLAMGANMNARSNAGYSPIHVAAEKGHNEFVKHLILLGVKVDVRANNLETPLHSALQYGSNEVVLTLLDNGADFLAKNNHDSALHRAVSGNNVDNIKCIIERMKDKFEQDPSELYQFLNYKDAEGDTPLMWATEKGRYEAGKILLENGVDINIQNNSGMTALHWAAKNGHLETVQLLIDNKANANIKDFNGKNAFQVARERSFEVDDQDNFNMISSFLLSVTDEESIRVPEEIPTLQQLSEDDINSLVTLASTVGARCSHTQRRKKRGVWDCSDDGFDREIFKEKEYDDVVRWLVEKKGADINVVNNFGRSILHTAVEKGNLPLVMWLVDKGSNVNARDNDGNTVLHFAVSSARLNLVKWIVEKQHAQINDVDKLGRTALHFAASNGYKEIAEYLAANGANLDIRDMNHDTAEDLARKSGHTEMVSLLQKANVERHMQEFNLLKDRLVVLKSEQERIGLEPLGNGMTGNACGSMHRRKRKVGSCTDEKVGQVFPYEPMDETVRGDLSRMSKLYSHIAMAVVLEHPSHFLKADSNSALDLITTYNGFVGEIVSEGISNHSPREDQILRDHYDKVEKFFRDFPENTLINPMENESSDVVHLMSPHKSWLFLNNRDTMSVFNVNGRYQLFSSGLNYQLRFETRADLTLPEVKGFIRAFFKWRSGNSEYTTFTLAKQLSEKVLSALREAPFWAPDKVAPDGILLANKHLGLIESIPSEIVRELFFVDGRSPDVASLHSDFFKHYQDNITFRLEILHKTLPSLTEAEIRALVMVVKKYKFPVNILHNDNLFSEEKSLLRSYQHLVEHELQTTDTITLKALSDLSWTALSEGLEKYSDISNDLSEKVVTTSKDLHAFATKSAWAKGMATQTMFFLPDIIRASNSGDVSSLAQTGSMLTGDATINNLYTGLVNNLEEVLPEGRTRILRALPVTSPVFKALTVYSIVELTKQLQALPATSETRGVIEHKLGEQYMTAGLMVAELLGFEVTPLWIGLIAEQLIFDADAFRKQNHLDVPFWEAFLMSLGFEQDKLRTVLEERQLVEMNLSMVNKLNEQSSNHYGWVIVKVPKLGDLTWKDINRDKVPKEIRRKINSMKTDVSPRAVDIFSSDGFRLVNKYKLNRYLVVSSPQMNRGKLLKSIWQKCIYQADPKRARIQLSLNYNDPESFKQEDNVFLDETRVDNIFYKRVPSKAGGRFANGMDPVRRNGAEAGVYVNNQTYTEATAQSNFYVGFDPREGNLDLEFTPSGLEKIDTLNTVHNLRVKASTKYNSYNGSSPFIVTVQVGHKPYPEAIEFSNPTGSFSLLDKSMRVITQYLIAGNIPYVIRDESAVTRLVLSAHVSTKPNNINSICSTINDDGPDTIVVKNWQCTEDAAQGTYGVKQLKMINNGIISLRGYRKYLQLHSRGHLIEKQLSVSAEHVDILEAEGKVTDQSLIQLGAEVGSFNLTILGNIIVKNGPTRLELSGKVTRESLPLNYFKTINKIISFYNIGVNDLKPIVKSLSRVYRNVSEKQFVDVKFSTAGLNCTWKNSSPGSCSLKVKGYFNGKSSVLNVEQTQDVLTIFESEARVASVDIKHYDKIGQVKAGLLLQDVYTPTDSDSIALGGNQQLRNTNRLKSLHGPGTILTFLSPEGHHVYHWFPSGDRIFLNGVGYTVNRSDICAVDGNAGRIDGRKMIKHSEIMKGNRKSGSMKERLVGICFGETLEESEIDVRNGSLVVNGITLQYISEKTRIHFTETDVFTIRTLMDSLVRGGGNSTFSRQHIHKRSASVNIADDDHFVDLDHKSISIIQEQDISNSFTNIGSRKVKVAPYSDKFRYTVSHFANTMEIDDLQSDRMESDRTRMLTTSLNQSTHVVYDKDLIDRLDILQLDQLQSVRAKAEENDDVNVWLEQLDSQIVLSLTDVLARRVHRNNGSHCLGFEEKDKLWKIVDGGDKLTYVLKHEHTIRVFILLVIKLYYDSVLKSRNATPSVLLHDVDKCFNTIFHQGIVHEMMGELKHGNVLEQVKIFAEIHERELQKTLRGYIDEDLIETYDEVQRVIDASPPNVASGATSLSSSSVNKFLNWLRDAGGWIESRVLDPCRSLPSRSGNYEAALHKEASNNSSPSDTAAFSHFHLNETLVFVDFLVRTFTKVKPPRISSTHHSMSLFEAQVYALKITSSFDALLEQQVQAKIIPSSELVFNPVTLQTRLLVVIRNGDYSKILQVLVGSLENYSSTIDVDIFNFLRVKIEEMLSMLTTEQLCIMNETRSDVNYDALTQRKCESHSDHLIDFEEDNLQRKPFSFLH